MARVWSIYRNHQIWALLNNDGNALGYVVHPPKTLHEPIAEPFGTWPTLEAARAFVDQKIGERI